MTMGYWLEIEKKDAQELSEHIEKALHHAGKAMMIAEEMCEGGEGGFRGGYRNSGYREGYRNDGYRNSGYREDERPMYDEYGNPMMGMRRMRDSSGRFM